MIKISCLWEFVREETRKSKTTQPHTILVVHGKEKPVKSEQQTGRENRSTRTLEMESLIKETRKEKKRKKRKSKRYWKGAFSFFF